MLKMDNLIVEVKENDKPAERRPFSCFILDGITYLPHYTKVGYYVGPGHRTMRHSKTNDVLFESQGIHEDVFFAAKAECVKKDLWVTPARKQTDNLNRNVATFKQFLGV
jgi:hypothetical protein